MQNHGVSLKYIRQLLMPVAIDILNDANILNSLKQLTNERGFCAHKFQLSGVLKKNVILKKQRISLVIACFFVWIYVTKQNLEL